MICKLMKTMILLCEKPFEIRVVVNRYFLVRKGFKKALVAFQNKIMKVLHINTKKLETKHGELEERH